MHRFSKLAVIFSAVLTAMAAASANGAVFFFSNNAGITINDNAAATPSPSNINVAGVTGVVTHVRVQIIGMSHTFPDDIDMAVTAPNGQGVMLMSDAGGGSTILNVNLTFDDCAVRTLPNSGQIVSGRFRPMEYDDDPIITGTDDPPSTLAAFNGLSGASVNGNWGLFVRDDVAGDSGGITAWSLTIYTDTSLPANTNPVPCGKPDFDGDGRADQVVYQAATGNWFAVGSSNSAFFPIALNFGGAGFTPVAGDYDGDGVTDAAVFQASTGNWFVIGSTQGFFVAALNFGGAGFTPVPGDYDGDGETDPAVYQTATGHWFILGSSKGFFTRLGFGGAGFTPIVPAAQ
jgi:subtilisin-like proprotein convertase family protein